MVPDSKKWTCATLSQQHPSGVTWGMNAFVLMGDKRVLHLLLETVAKECRPDRQDWQILRQVSSTQSHENNGAAKKVVSTVRGLAKTCLEMIKQRQNPVFCSDNTHTNPSVDIKHAAWVLTRYSVKKTRMTPHEKLRGHRKEILPLGNKSSLAVPERLLFMQPMGNRLLAGTRYPE